MTSPVDAIVIGAGPCGVAAAVQLKRSGFSPILFEARSVGGLLRNANLVENYPGFPRGIAGPRLCALLEEQVARAGVDLVIDRIVDALPAGGDFAVKTASARTLVCRCLIVATGTAPKTGLFAEPDALVGESLFYEVADLPECGPDRHVIIVGGSDAAYDYALNVAGRGARATIIQRGAARCLPLLKDRVAAAETIRVREGVNVLAVDRTAGGVAVRTADSEGVEETGGDYLLIACGREPEDALLRRLARTGKIANHVTPNLFSGGDLVRGLFRQAGIAVGDGLLAAMAAARYLRGECPPSGSR